MKVLVGKEVVARDQVARQSDSFDRATPQKAISKEPPSQSQAVEPAAWTAWIWPAATIAIVVIAYGHLIWQFCVNQWARAHYQYFPFVIGAFLWLMWRNGCDAERSTSAPTRLHTLGAIAFMIGAWLVLALAYLTFSPWLAVISAIFLIGSRLLNMSRGWRIEYLLGIWLMLWLIVPMPMNRDQQLISSLQHLSSRVSSAILDAVGIEHLMQGNTLLLPDKQFFVDEACSGIVSVLSVIACAVIYGVWRNRRPLHVVILAIAGVGWATIMNVMRITTIAIAYNQAGVDWSTGTIHEILGLISFTVIFLGLVSTDLLLVGMLAPIGSTLQETLGSTGQIGLGCVRLWDWFFASDRDDDEPSTSVEVGLDREAVRRLSLGLIPLAAFALLPILDTAYSRAKPPDLARVYPQALVDNALSCNQSALPATIGNLNFVKFTEYTRSRDDLMGNFSRTFEYRDQAGNDFIVSCDFPYERGWHELTICYEAIGWLLTNRLISDESAVRNGNAWTSMEAEFEKPNSGYGFLLASAFDDSGKPITIPTYTLFADIWRKLTYNAQRGSRQLAFQVQVWTISDKPIDDERRRNAQQLLRLARDKFHDAIMRPAAARNKVNPNSPDAGRAE